MSQGLAPHSAPSELSRMRSYTAKTAPLTATGAQQRTRLQLEGLAQAVYAKQGHGTAPNYFNHCRMPQSGQCAAVGTR